MTEWSSHGLAVSILDPQMGFIKPRGWYDLKLNVDVATACSFGVGYSLVGNNNYTVRKDWINPLKSCVPK